MGIGIIGGADGPTAIFITSSATKYWIGGAVLIAAVVIALIVRRIIRRAK